MKPLTANMSNSTHESLLHAGAATNSIGAPSHPLRDTDTHVADSVSAFSIHYNDLAVGLAATGETVVLIHNHFFRISSEGVPIDMQSGEGVTHAMIVTFDAEHLRNDFAVSGIEDLVDHCETLRAGKNIFYVLRVDGQFRSLSLRFSPNPQTSQHVAKGHLSADTRVVEDVDGTLIGIWSSRFTSGVCAPGYHFYFLSRERDCGGFVVNCSASGLRMLGMPVTSLRLIRPGFCRPEPGKTETA